MYKAQNRTLARPMAKLRWIMIMTGWPTATISSGTRRCRAADAGRASGCEYAGSSDTTRRAKKKKKEGACDAVARIVIGVEQELRDKKGQRC